MTDLPLTDAPLTDLPRLLLLTDRGQAPRPLPEVVADAVDAGARAVVLRERDLPDAERAALAAELRAVLAPVGGLLLVAGPAPLGDGNHLRATEPPPAARPPLLGRSCHDAAEVRAAAGCDWVTVSPVHATASKPGYGPALGLAGLRALTAAAPPVYALGGVGPASAAACREAGAHGVAVMGAVMRAARPGDVVAALLEELA